MAEGARLESVFTRKGNVGSNPTLSATDAGDIGIRSLRGSRLQSVGTPHTQTRQRSCPAVPDDAAVVDNLLKLGSCGRALPCSQVRLSANVRVVEAGDIRDKANLA